MAKERKEVDDVLQNKVNLESILKRIKNFVSLKILELNLGGRGGGNTGYQ